MNLGWIDSLICIGSPVRGFRPVEAFRFEQEKVKVTGATTGPKDDTIVASQVIGKGEPIQMDWQVRSLNGGLKIIDVKIEGISMLITTREEFGGIVSQKGMSGLLEAMKGKIEVMKAQSAGA